MDAAASSRSTPSQLNEWMQPIDMLTHAKSLLVLPPDVAIDHLFPPYTPEKNAALTQWLEY